MDKLIIASADRSAGKTNIIVGLGKSLNKKCGYIKPFGDRLFYRKKRLWDYDSAIVSEALSLTEPPEEISIGFEHSKLRFMYDKNSINAKLNDLIGVAGKDKEVMFIEMGRDLSFGASVYLDAISVAKTVGGKLIVVISDSNDCIVDTASYIKNYINMSGCDFRGVIVNKIKDVDDFNETTKKYLSELGIPLIGAIPFKSELSELSLKFLSDVLFAKVVAGEKGLDKFVKNVFVGAMSANVALRSSVFNAENKLIITGGDRSDMILAALETNAVGVILTNNILPPANILSQAESKNVPMLLVSQDTFQIAKRVDELEPLLTRGDTERMNLIGKLVKENVDLSKI